MVFGNFLNTADTIVIHKDVWFPKHYSPVSVKRFIRKSISSPTSWRGENYYGYVLKIYFYYYFLHETKLIKNSSSNQKPPIATIHCFIYSQSWTQCYMMNCLLGVFVNPLYENSVWNIKFHYICMAIFNYQICVSFFFFFTWGNGKHLIHIRKWSQVGKKKEYYICYRVADILSNIILQSK